MNDDHEAADIHGVPDSERLSRAGQVAGGEAVAGENCTERDIVERLRDWRSVHLARLHLLMEEAAEEIELLRGYRDEAESDAAIARLALDRLRLTNAEREAVDRAMRAFRDIYYNDMTMQQLEDYEALCDMLERLK